MSGSTEDEKRLIIPSFSVESRVAQGDRFLCRETGSIIPPIYPSTTYARDEAYERVGGRGYSRDDNPTYDVAERMVADLEGGAAARLYASGMAAITALLQALRPGDHVVAGRAAYFGTPKLLRDWAREWGLGVDLVDTTDLAAVEAALRPGATRLVLIETPANPGWDVTDIRAVAELAHGAGATLVVDSTAATPVFQRPLDLGADIVMHSATKYLNGHSDVIAGVLVAGDAAHPLFARAAHLRYLAGAVLGPFEAWLLQRGMRTLFVRARRQADSAMAVARHFEGHPGLRAVLYPGLPSFPGHEVARRQMQGGFGGMLSLRVAGGREAALAMISRVRLFVRATSLGGVESLIEHRHTIEGGESDTPADLLRVSIGLEDPADLIADLEQALEG